MAKRFPLFFLFVCMLYFFAGGVGAEAGQDSTDVNINTGAVEKEEEGGLECTFSGTITLRTIVLDKQTSACTYCFNCSPAFWDCTYPARSGVLSCPQERANFAYIKSRYCEKKKIRKETVQCVDGKMDTVNTSTFWTPWDCRCTSG